jgi:NAD(P) transhydrogenase subunit alpha
VCRHAGVTVIGYVDLPSRLAPTASQLYGSNLVHLLTDMGGAERFRIDFEDEVVRGALVAHDGGVLGPPPRREPAPAPAAKPGPSAPAVEAKPKRSYAAHALLLAGLAFLGIGLSAPPAFVAHLSVFVLACFVGYQVVWNVTPALHTPLMSVTNAISGIILIGGMLQISGPPDSVLTILAAVAVLVATINISGGFLVTQRMLKMFQR